MIQSKAFSVVNEAKVDVFLEFSCFFYDPIDLFKKHLLSNAYSVSGPGMGIGDAEMNSSMGPQLL